MLLCRVTALTILLSALWSGASSAQTAPSDDAERARALFNEGIDLADHGDWATAVERFERALALREAPSIRLNLALSLAHLGRLVDAIGHLDAMGDPAAVPQDLRAQARELRDEIGPRIGRIVVRVRGDASTCVTEVGRRRLSAEEIGEPVTIDPGPSQVRLVCDQRIADEIEVTVPDGGAVHVVLAMDPSSRPPAQVTDAPTPVAAPPTTSGGDVTSEAWFWIVIGVVAAGAVAGGTAAAVIASQPAPTAGDFGPPVLRFELAP